METSKKLSRDEMRNIKGGGNRNCTIICHTQSGNLTAPGFGTCLNDDQNCKLYFGDPTATAISCSCVG